MHNIKWIRDNPDIFDEAMKRRGLAPQSAEILKLDEESRGDITNLQALQEESNKLAKQIGELMREGKQAEAQDVIARSKEVKEQLATLKDAAQEGGESEALTAKLATLPNLFADDVPEGADETDNQEIRRWGEPKTVNEFGFPPKDHMTLAEGLEQHFLSSMDFEQTAKISGSRFVTLSGQLARLERALGDFMLDVHTKEFGYLEVSPPVLVRDEAMYGTSQLPKFAEDSYQTREGHWLIPTAEVSLTNLVADRILEEEQLPIRMVARTPCFRSEAGSAGRDTRGMMRHHQFSKVELVSIVTPETAEAEHERLVGCAEAILQRLELPYRTVLLCSGDTGFGARKTYDIEVWVPEQNTYREISSCSQFGDFQARRMQARYRKKGEKGASYVHTLNGSGLAIGRTLLAVLENYQQKDGSILVPNALKSYLNGDSVIK